MSIQQIADWYAAASPEARKKLLIQLQAYPVSGETWYIHPNHWTYPGVCQTEIGEHADTIKKFDLPEPGFINDWII